MKTKIILLFTLLPLLGGAVSAHCAERFAGRFKGEGLVLESQGDQGNYSGTITLDENAFKFTASDKEDGLAGSFATSDGQFDFQAVLKGDTLTLTTGGIHYKLTRLNSNPLAKAKASDPTGAKVKDFVRQQGGGFLGQFVSSVANNKGHVSESAKSAAFGTLASISQTQFGAAPPQNSSAPSTQPAVPPTGTVGAVAAKDPRATGLPGTWTKSEQNVVNGVANTRLIYCVFRSDGSMLITVNPQTVRSFSNDQPTAAGVSQTADGDIRARWSINNAVLTLTYDSGASAQYGCEIFSSASGSPVLRIHGADGSAIQEWTKSNN